jgi:hypothetical protein
MLEKIIKKFNSKPINLELEMRKLRVQLNNLQINELEINSNYISQRENELKLNRNKQYGIIDTLFTYQKNNPNFRYN